MFDLLKGLNQPEPLHFAVKAIIGLGIDSDGHPWEFCEKYLPCARRFSAPLADEPDLMDYFPAAKIPRALSARRLNKAAAILKRRTLTNLYNERTTWLDNAHRDLDVAVAAAYGWPADIAEDEALARLLALNPEGHSAINCGIFYIAKIVLQCYATTRRIGGAEEGMALSTDDMQGAAVGSKNVLGWRLKSIRFSRCAKA